MWDGMRGKRGRDEDRRIGRKRVGERTARQREMWVWGGTEASGDGEGRREGWGGTERGMGRDGEKDGEGRRQGWEGTERGMGRDICGGSDETSPDINLLGKY